MDDTFFEFMNVTLPRASNCPIEYAELKECRLEEDSRILFMDFAVPVIDNNYTIVEADPFFLMLKQSKQTCRLEYRVSQNEMISQMEYTQLTREKRTEDGLSSENP